MSAGLRRRLVWFLAHLHIAQRRSSFGSTIGPTLISA
jgi:hypothetical protein